MKTSIQVLLVDDCPIVYEGIRNVFENGEGINLVEMVKGCHPTKLLLSKHQPDVLLLDIETSRMDVLETIRVTRQYCPNTKILAFSQPCSPAYVQKLLTAGINGYVLKSEDPDFLLAAIRTVVKGGCCFSKSILTMLNKQPEDKPAICVLTPRENQILSFLSKGYNNQQIAGKLHLAKQTVANYISCIYEKLGVQSRAEAILWQIKNQSGTNN